MYKVHRDKCCQFHPDRALVETQSASQLVCPEYDCDFHLKLLDGKWVPHDGGRKLKGQVTTALNKEVATRKVVSKRRPK